MGIVSDLREGRMAQRQVKRLMADLVQRDDSLNLFHERLAELELSLEDDGWARIGAMGERDFSDHARKKITDLSRIMYLKNPLIRRGVSVRTYYTWGQGVNIGAAYEPANRVIQGFLDHPANRQSLTSHQAHIDRDHDLQVEGELFFVFFPNPSTGEVKTRTIRPFEIDDIITNPNDDLDPWFYRRRWSSQNLDLDSGRAKMEEGEAYYPALWFRPDRMPETINGIAVVPEPIYHFTATGIGGMKRGVPDTYAAMDWARAYKDFLTDWASIVRSLNRWAWKYRTGSRQRVEDVKDRMATTVGPDTSETNPAPTTGSMMITPSEGDLTPIPKTGATISADDARALRTMVAASFDLPDTILSGDVDIGNLATAKTLDRPTELAMANRQAIWGDVLTDILTYVMEQAVLAPSAPLGGTVTYPAGRPVFELEIDPATQLPADPSIDIDFPPILEQDVTEQVSAIVKSATLDGKLQAGTIPREDVSRMLLVALGQSNIDQTLAELFPSTEAAEVLAAVQKDIRELIAESKRQSD